MKKLVTALALIGLPVVAMAQYGGSFHNGGHMMGFGGGGFMFMGLFWLALLGIVIWIVITLAKNSRSMGSSSEGHDASVQIVRSRFAKGEITKDEMDELISHLK